MAYPHAKIGRMDTDAGGTCQRADTAARGGPLWGGTQPPPTCPPEEIDGVRCAHLLMGWGSDPRCGRRFPRSWGPLRVGLFGGIFASPLTQLAESCYIVLTPNRPPDVAAVPRRWHSRASQRLLLPATRPQTDQPSVGARIGFVLYLTVQYIIALARAILN